MMLPEADCWLMATAQLLSLVAPLAMEQHACGYISLLLAAWCNAAMWQMHVSCIMCHAIVGTLQSWVHLPVLDHCCMLSQAKNYMTRSAPSEHKVKLSSYRQVLKQSGAAGLPALGAGNARVLLSYDGLVGLVDYLLKAPSLAEEEDGEEGSESSQGPDAADGMGAVCEQLEWLTGGNKCHVVVRDQWDVSAYAADDADVVIE